MSEDVTLKPCPFCGGEPTVLTDELYDGSFSIECCQVGCRVDVQGETYDSGEEDKAIKHWNTRAGEHAAHERGKAEVQARWKAQRESIIQTLEEWQAAYDGESEGEYQRAIGDVLAWLNGDIP